MARRYLGLDTWEGLLRRFAARTSRPFEFFRSSANGNFPRIASEIAGTFHDIWWTSPDYETSRDQNLANAHSRESALKIEIANYIHSQSNLEDYLAEDLADEIDALRTASVDAIITTNWDTLLEQLFPEFKVYIGQSQLLFSTAHGLAEIYKVHGCTTDPNSLVLTANDYHDFNARNPYLAAKLLTTFLEHPIIFLGYSLTDDNVHLILSEIAKCLTTSNIERLRDRMILVEWARDAADLQMTQTSIVTNQGLPIPILKVTTNSFLPVFQALNGLRRKFPARILRQLKEHVYELVRDNDPTGRIYVQDIDAAEDNPSEVDLVFGVGAIGDLKSLGYRGLAREDLVSDILHENGNYDAEEVVREVLPRVMRQARFVPMFRYLRLAGYLDDNGALAKAAPDQRIAKAATACLATYAPPSQYRKKANDILKYASFAELAADTEPEQVVNLAPLLPEDRLESSDILAFLKEHEARLLSGNDLVRTQFVKLVCLYDWLRYVRAV